MNYLIVKKVSNGAYLILNGNRIFINKKDTNYQEILNLADKYNSNRLVNKRKEIYDKIKDLSTPKFLKEVEKIKDFIIKSDGQLYLSGISVPIPEELAEIIKDGLENNVDISIYRNFWANLVVNPDTNVRSQLFNFLRHNGHPITKHGYFLAYKAVRVSHKFDTKTGKKVLPDIYDPETGERKLTQDLVFTTIHQGPYGNIIKVGQPISMPREECDSDNNVTCSRGLHVGSMEYVKTFGDSDSVILECLINPRHVVAVPVDYNNTKMRVCQYYPYSIANGENKEIYLETDYIDYDKEELEKDISLLEQDATDYLAKFEEKLAYMKKLSGKIY